MTWFILARTLFVAAIAFTAGLLQPLTGFGLGRTGGMAVNVAFGAGARRSSSSCFEIRLREDVAVTTTARRPARRRRLGLVIAKTIEAALTWTDTRDAAVALPAERRPPGAAVHRHR